MSLEKAHGAFIMSKYLAFARIVRRDIFRIFSFHFFHASKARVGRLDSGKTHQPCTVVLGGSNASSILALFIILRFQGNFIIFYESNLE